MEKIEEIIHTLVKKYDDSEVGVGLKENEITKLEEELNVIFPEDYRFFLSKYGYYEPHGAYILGAGCWVLGAGCWVLGAIRTWMNITRWFILQKKIKSEDYLNSLWQDLRLQL